MAQVVPAQMLADFVQDDSLAGTSARWANALLNAAQAAVEQWSTGRSGSFTSGSSHTETLYLRLASSVVPLRYGPATAYTSVTLNDVDYTARFELRPYSLRVRPASTPDALTTGGVLAGTKITVTYTQGWSDLSKVPDPIVQAILLTTVPLLSRQDGSIVREQVGQVQVSYQPGVLSVPPLAQSLLQEYRDPGMVGI